MANILITGSSSGFGFEGALAFARNGDRVYATVRHPAKSATLQKIADEENLDIHIRLLDVAQPESFDAFIKDTVEHAGAIDVLVNNAGILKSGALEDLPEQSIRQVLDTNYLGPILLARAVLPQMRKQKSGFIIMLSSVSGIAGLAGDVAYTGSKFALEGATEALRHEVSRWGIHVALVQGGLYATSIFEPDMPESSVLPEDYPQNSPYRPLIENQLKQLRQRMPEALDPAIIGNLLVEIAQSDGSQLRWPADDVAKMVIGKMFGQTDSERDDFLRGASGIDWWRQGKEAPDE